MSSLYIIIFLFISFSRAFYSNKAISETFFIDSSNTESLRTGSSDHPFNSLSEALLAFNQIASKLPPVSFPAISQLFNCAFLFKEGTVISHLNFSLLTRQMPPLTRFNITMTTYSTHKKNPLLQEPARFLFSKNSDHFAFDLGWGDLVLQNIHFQFSLSEPSENQELILFKGRPSSSLLDFRNCRFENFQLNLSKTEFAIMRFLNISSLAFTSNLFSNLRLSSTLLKISNSRLTFKENTVRNISMDEGAALIDHEGSGFTVKENEMKLVSGGIFSGRKSTNGALVGNRFEDISGNYPIKLEEIPSFRITKNVVNYNQNQRTLLKGFLYVSEFCHGEIGDFAMQGYYGSVPALLVLKQKTTTCENKGMLSIRFWNSTLTGNTMILEDGVQKADSGLIKIETNDDEKVSFFLSDHTFSKNTILDQREKDLSLSSNISSSVLWVKSKMSNLILKGSRFEQNRASNLLNNFYINVKDIKVEQSEFISNGLVQDLEKKDDNRFQSFIWIAETLLFSNNIFRENYASFGGAISFLKKRMEGKTIKRCIIMNCTFVENQAKIGGAIYSNLPTAVELKDNRFIQNKAVYFPEFNPNPNFVHQTKMKIVMHYDQKIFGTNQLTIRNLLNEEQFKDNFELYLVDSYGAPFSQKTKFLTTLQIRSYEDPFGNQTQINEGFIDRVTGPKFTLNSLTVKARLGSRNTIIILMKNEKDISEQYSFEFQVQMSVEHEKCVRGEYYQRIGDACLPCPSGTYSFSANHSTCSPCPKGADCSLGKDHLSVLPGFWRNVTDTSEILNIYKCDNQEENECLGGRESLCREGYTGPKCEVCEFNPSSSSDNKFFRPFLNQCRTCENSLIFSLFTILIPLLVPVLSVYFLFNSRGSNNKESVEFSDFLICLKIFLLTSLFHNLFILDSLDYLTTPKIALSFVHMIVNPSFLQLQFFMCYLSNFTPALLFTLYLIIFATKVSLVILTTKLTCKVESFSKSILSIFIWLFYLEGPGFLQSITDIFGCQTHEGSEYSKFSSNLSCHKSLFISSTVVVLFVGIAFLVPLLISILLTKTQFHKDAVFIQQRLNIMIFAKREQYIEKSNRSWLCFYYVSFAKSLLLLLSNSDQLSSTLCNLLLISFLLSQLILNSPRKIPSLKHSCCSNALLINLLVPLLFLLASHSPLNQGFRYLLLCITLVYVIVVLCLDSSVQTQKTRPQVPILEKTSYEERISMIP